MRLNIDLKDEIYQELKQSAQEEGRSISDVVRVLINDWLSEKRDRRKIGAKTLVKAFKEMKA